MFITFNQRNEEKRIESRSRQFLSEAMDQFEKSELMKNVFGEKPFKNY
jgi:glutamine synthetase